MSSLPPELRFRYVILRGKVCGIQYLFYGENPKHKALKGLRQLSMAFDQFMIDPDTIPDEFVQGYAVPLHHDLQPMYQRGFISGLHQMLLQIEEDMHPLPEALSLSILLHTQGLVEAYDWAIKEEPDCTIARRELEDREARFIKNLSNGNGEQGASPRAFSQGYVDGLREIVGVLCRAG